jgi:hypothetical protein
MPTPEVEEFAERLMILVRDLAIQSCDRNLLSRMKSQEAMRWRVAMSGDAEEFAKIAIPDCVDRVLFRLLDAIDNGMGLFYRASNGDLVDLQKEGLMEMAGWLWGDEGWIKKYSKERDNLDIVPSNYR